RLARAAHGLRDRERAGGRRARALDASRRVARARVRGRRARARDSYVGRARGGGRDGHDRVRGCVRLRRARVARVASRAARAYVPSQRSGRRVRVRADRVCPGGRTDARAQVGVRVPLLHRGARALGRVRRAAGPAPTARMSKELPRFSVVVPTYERHAQLAACIGALARLDYPRERFEVLIVDDGSARRPREVVEPFRDALDVKLLAQENKGPAAARNLGARHARGEFLAFTDDDCEPEREWLRAFALRFAQEPERVVGGRTVNA